MCLSMYLYGENVFKVKTVEKALLIFISKALYFEDSMVKGTDSPIIRGMLKSNVDFHRVLICNNEFYMAIIFYLPSTY